MIRIGMTGGVGAGKSQVLDWLEERWKARIIRTDDVAKGLMEPGQEGYRQVTAALGTSFLKEDGQIDRPALAKLIFQSRETRELVDGITHPLVWREVQRELKQAEQEGCPAAVVESAVFDGNSMELLDELWYVHASEEVRAQRLMTARGYSRERCRSMMESQLSEEEFRSISSRVIENGGSWEDTKNQLDREFTELNMQLIQK
ncbi:MAG: dephospho-CoA kinase [Lachnospiraceae bacterium]|nr:dephospho-CoA kinase [Lachnospiraceae bacterium]